MEHGVSVYGADGCMETGRTREHLQDLGIRHRYFNVEEDTMAELRVRTWNEGKRCTPIVIVRSSDGMERLSAPSHAELDEVLARFGLLSAAGR
ncbi:MAG TPA: hypothetical protein VK864_04760 [Longimicrobiales bacterium]|nr:hypothetical protein [Longimicrobiales bacterium]